MIRDQEEHLESTISFMKDNRHAMRQSTSLSPSLFVPVNAVTHIPLFHRVASDVEFEVKRWIRFQFPLKWKDAQVLLECRQTL
jgi:hypothetical protein